jgi:gliding motility-associated-like protein
LARMKTKHFNLTVVLLSFCSCYAFTQCIVPDSPVLISVSVQPETGRTEFTWQPSESSDIAAYILYLYTGGDGHAIDTVWDPAATSHTISNTAPKYSSVSYVVAAYRLSAVPGMPGCVSALSNVLSTIFCEAIADTCNKKITVSWNSYPSYPKVVVSYSVMLSIDGSPFSEATSTEPDNTSFTINNFTTDAEYCFYIRADLEGGFFSTSNKICVLTRMQRPPGWINADYATVNSDSRIALSFSIDPASEITHFRLERKTGISGTYESIANLEPVNGLVLYTDLEADVNAANYYRLSAINSCNNPITVSNIASNMVLSLKGIGSDWNLAWNSYRQWLGLISDYRLFIDTGKGFEEKAVIEASDSLFTLDYKNIMYEVSANEICMYISASEILNPYGITGQSASSVICTEPIELITVPNIFTPDNDLVNDLFKPVLSFTPTDYHLIISDRHGSVLFETRDYQDSWDGSKKGNPQPEGVCLWFLKVITPSGKSMTRTGTVTILKNP